MKSAVEAAEHANATPDFYHSVVEAEYSALESAIFGSAETMAEEALTPPTQAATSATGDEDVAMDDDDAPAAARTAAASNV